MTCTVLGHVDRAKYDARIAELERLLKRALEIASDDNDEIFGGDLRARETAIFSWKREARAAISTVEGK